MDPIWLLFAFGFGFAVKWINLPPMIGFLLAGFALNFMGVESSDFLDEIADYGVLLLLFTIGLKLKVKTLLRKEIWLTSTLHMAVSIILLSLCITLLAGFGLYYFANLELYQIVLVSFALSFSSTIFGVKILEETGASKSTHGRIAIGVLIMQDIFAVIFLTLTSDTTTSPWALALLLLLALPWLLRRTKLTAILDFSGHGELFIILGFMLPIASAGLFYSVGLKPDLGAVVIGILLAGHPRASEMSKTLMNFKDLFLVGFFLNIGILGLPSWDEVGIALLFTLLLPIKMILFFLILTRLRLRARTSYLTTLNLGNYSEFGLIVGTAAMAQQWLSPQWMTIFALCISFSFVLASPLNVASARIYAALQSRLLKFERNKRLEEDEPIVFEHEEVIVFGMGRTGNQVYEVMENRYGKKVLGIDQNHDKIELLEAEGKNVIQGDAMDLNFWQRINLSDDPPAIILATSSHVTHMSVIEQLNELHCSLSVSAISRYEDEMEELKDAGVQLVFNLYEEAGIGFAEDSFNSFYGGND